MRQIVTTTTEVSTPNKYGSIRRPFTDSDITGSAVKKRIQNASGCRVAKIKNIPTTIQMPCGIIRRRESEIIGRTSGIGTEGENRVDGQRACWVELFLKAEGEQVVLQDER